MSTLDPLPFFSRLQCIRSLSLIRCTAGRMLQSYQGELKQLPVDGKIKSQKFYVDKWEEGNKLLSIGCSRGTNLDSPTDWNSSPIEGLLWTEQNCLLQFSSFEVFLVVL